MPKLKVCAVLRSLGAAQESVVASLTRVDDMAMAAASLMPARTGKEGLLPMMAARARKTVAVSLHVAKGLLVVHKLAQLASQASLASEAAKARTKAASARLASLRLQADAL